MSASSAEPIQVCASTELLDGKAGVRFPIRYRYARSEHLQVGFAIRFEGQVHGYVNQCAHVPIEMDWQPGEFFDHSGLYLMCATHGAIYEPESGLCVGGPCRGSRLRVLNLLEHDGLVFWQPDDAYGPLP